MTDTPCNYHKNNSIIPTDHQPASTYCHLLRFKSNQHPSIHPQPHTLFIIHYNSSITDATDFTIFLSIPPSCPEEILNDYYYYFKQKYRAFLVPSTSTRH
mmetsp:Transcript_3653/g.6906  ORF Transcript_3653/g.6906 Transcript_3653/m.6906 type:complete len:100 (-) Transcript_3653:5953-6252(-)